MAMLLQKNLKIGRFPFHAIYWGYQQTVIQSTTAT